MCNDQHIRVSPVHARVPIRSRAWTPRRPAILHSLLRCHTISSRAVCKPAVPLCSTLPCFVSAGRVNEWSTEVEVRDVHLITLTPPTPPKHTHAHTHTHARARTHLVCVSDVRSIMRGIDCTTSEAGDSTWDHGMARTALKVYVSN